MPTRCARDSRSAAVGVGKTQVGRGHCVGQDEADAAKGDHEDCGQRCQAADRPGLSWAVEHGSNYGSRFSRRAVAEHAERVRTPYARGRGISRHGRVDLRVQAVQEKSRRYLPW